MKSKAICVAVSCLLATTAFAQGRGQAPQEPPAETVAPNIPGVVAGGTKVQVIKAGFEGTEGPVALADGSVIFTETNANRITRIDRDDNVSTFLQTAHRSNALALDAKGRLISLQDTRGETNVAVRDRP
jgi:gluconolactonase